MELTDIGVMICARRAEAGLSQEQLGRMSGLPCVRIKQLENGTLNDPGFSKLRNVLDILGVDLRIGAPAGVKSALVVAARSISTSYRDVVTPELLAEMLRSGSAPERFHPHLMSFLDETPLPVAVKAIAEAATMAVPAMMITKNLAAWATEWKVCRTVWL